MKRSTIVFWLLLAVGLVAGRSRRRRAARRRRSARSTRDGTARRQGARAHPRRPGRRRRTSRRQSTDSTPPSCSATTSPTTSAAPSARWVESGGTLLVADPCSSLHPGRFVGDTQTIFGEATVATRRLLDPAALEPDAVSTRRAACSTTATPATQSCFTRGDGAFVVADPRGDGWVVAVGGAGRVRQRPSRLRGQCRARREHRSCRRTGTRVAFLERANPATGEGDKSLSDLVPTARAASRSRSC